MLAKDYDDIVKVCVCYDLLRFNWYCVTSSGNLFTMCLVEVAIAGYNHCTLWRFKKPRKEVFIINSRLFYKHNGIIFADVCAETVQFSNSFNFYTCIPTLLAVAIRWTRESHAPFYWLTTCAWIVTLFSQFVVCLFHFYLFLDWPIAMQMKPPCRRMLLIPKTYIVEWVFNTTLLLYVLIVNCFYF